MQGNSFIEPQDILNATNGGLEIIFMVYPDARGSETKHNRKFKIREEKSASASLKRADDGNWLVTDFGNDSKPRNGIQCYQFERGISWVDAIKELAVKFNVLAPERQAQLIKADFTRRPANADEDDGKWSYEVRPYFSELDIETIISKYVLKHLDDEFNKEWKSKLSKTGVNADGKLEDKNESARSYRYSKIAATLKKYHWHSLISYSIVKNREVMTFASNDLYPIFLIDEGTHKKIYQPRHHEKNMRFMYEPGHKPADFIHGLAQLEEEYKANKKRIESEESDEELNAAGSQGEELETSVETKKGKKTKSPKIEELVLATGGSDAINIALMGDRVIWLNSETATLHQWQYDKLMPMVDKLYQLPDIDLTGKREAHKLAMQYLDIFTVELPEALKERRDPRGNPCKDVRDYFNWFGFKDYRALKETSLPYRFWDKTPNYEGRGENKTFKGFRYEFNHIQAYNFLQKNGFGRLLCGDMKTEWMFVHNQNGVVRQVDASIIEDFVNDFLEERRFSIELRNAIIKGTGLNSTSLAKIKKVQIDFKDHTPDSQFFFFQNKTVEVSAAGLQYHKPGSVSRFIWEEDMLRHNMEESKTAPFKITKNDINNYDIEILDKNCPFLKYLVQTSRIHWRTELEKNLESLFQPKDRDQYLVDNHCTIAGANLTAEEIDEQKQNLISKLFCIGYLLHRQKARNKAWFVWAMDSKIPDDAGSHGGSGKSILFDVAMRLMMPKNHFINGRNSKLNDDQFKYDGLSEHDRYILVEDAHQYVNLDVFYPDVTSDIKVNPKGKAPFIIPFERSAKIAFTSNYPPRNLTPSTERRMIYYVCSDYYHNKGETDDYREVRDPLSDLGVSFFTSYDKDQFNSFYNVMMHCVKFYLGVDEKLKPAMENVNKRNLLGIMGNFHDWALVYFSEMAERLNTFVIREEAFKDYILYSGKASTPQAFLTKLKAFCRYYSYELNPKAYCNQGTSILKKVDSRMYNKDSNSWIPIPQAPKETKEVIYIRTEDLIERPEPGSILAPEPPKQTHLDLGNNYVPPEPDPDEEFRIDHDSDGDDEPF